MLISTAVSQLVGDFGNPNGNGLALLQLSDIPQDTLADAKASFDTFVQALKSGGWTDCNLGDQLFNFRDASYADKPAAGVNIDRKIVVRWRTKEDPTPRSFTVSGIPDACVHVEDTKDGERVSEAGKLAMAALLNAMYDIVGPDSAVVLSGVVYQKR
jgi:hypothetical protein